MSTIEFFNIPLLEWIGYLASVLVLISLSLSSIFKLRVFNLIGSLVFSFYGFAIGALPVGIMNLVIVLTNIYYLRKLYFKKDQFDIVEVKSSDAYAQKFLHFYRNDIAKFFPEFDSNQMAENETVLVLRNMNLAGILITQHHNDTINIVVDYVTPQYRDFKNGRFVYEHFQSVLAVKNKKVFAETKNPKHVKYLYRMGFEPLSDNAAVFQLKK